MKRLRLRKLWVVVAIVLLLTPLLSGRLEKTDATAPTQTTDGNPTSSYTIKFIVDGVADDGESMPRFEMKSVENTETGFVKPNGARIKMEIWVNGKRVPEIDQTYEPKWTVTVNNVDVTDNTADLNGMTVIPYDKSTDPDDQWDAARRVYDITASASGLLVFNVHVDLQYKDANGQIVPGMITPIDRQALITVPLQIMNQKTGTVSYYKYAYAEPGETINLWVNNVKSSKMYWYYYDFTTEEYVKLEDPNAVDTKKATITTGKLGLTSGLKSGDDDDENYRPVRKANNNIDVFEYPLTVNSTYGGISRIVGRIYLNNDDGNSDVYIEQTFDVLIKAKAKNGLVENGERYIDMEYGQTRPFTSFSNDKGNSLEWYLEEHGRPNDATQPFVVDLINGVGALGKYYGEQKVYLTPVPMYNSWTKWEDADDRLNDHVTFRTKFSILNGDVEQYREKSTGYEVVDVNGKITLSTNVKGASNYDYNWYWLDGDGNEVSFTSTPNELIDVSGITTFGGSWSGISIEGKKAGEVKIRCRVNDRNNPTVGVSGGPLTDDVILKVVDALTLNENRRSVVKGGSFKLVAETTDLAGTITWTSSDPEYVTVDPTGKEVTVTGIEVTGDKYIDITATHVPSGRTAICKVRVVEVMSAVTIEGEKTISKGSLSDLWLEFAGPTPNYSKDDLKWVIKNKGTDDASTIIKLTQNEADPTKATVGGLEVGEAYVAVILTEIMGNSIVETELAVATIKVVSSPDGIKIEEGPEIIDYLNNETYTLHATVLPKGYTDDDLPVYWKSSDENIATVEPLEDNDRIAVVTYKAVGNVYITAEVATNAAAIDRCRIDIQNPVGDITLEPESLRMKVGDTARIKATVTPADATDRSLTWESNDPSIATVDESGYVTAVAPGTTFITVIASNGQMRKQCPVTVLVPADGIELNYYNMTVKKGTVFYLSAKILPEDAYDKGVTFESSDEEVAFVEQDGTVTARMVGTAEIIVKSIENPELTAICVVTVTESVSGLTLNSRQETIKVGEQFLLKATVRPSDSLNQEVTFESADPSIATVDENGLITGVKGGVTVIIVKTVERGLMATCTITVQEDIQSITLSETETYLAKGKNKKLTATILPASATKKKLKWTSSDESIVIVDSEGNIHGVNLGEAIITATAQDDGKVSATCKVTVIDATTKITLNQTIIRIMERDTYQLTYTIEPNYASVQRVNWTTSDASVARVDSLGLVTGVGAGEAKIRATAADGSGVYAECTVIVTPIILTTNVRVDSPATTLVVGETRTMTARTQPRNTTEAIRWVSENPSVVTIDSDGNMRAVGPGVAQITAISSVSGIEGTSTITVLGLNATSVTLEQYDTFDLYLDGVDSTVTWFSRNKRIATVTRRGVVTGRREGTTDVVARVGGKLVSCEVNVEKLRK